MSKTEKSMALKAAIEAVTDLHINGSKITLQKITENGQKITDLIDSTEFDLADKEKLHKHTESVVQHFTSKLNKLSWAQ